MKNLATALAVLLAFSVIPANAAILRAGETVKSVLVDDVIRTYRIYAPRRADRNGGLIIAFHGGGGTGKGFAGKAELAQLAETGGFVVAIPDGMGKTWNAGDGRHDADDLAFVDRIITDIGMDRVYATGLSRGGMFAYWLACNRGIDAIAVVAGTLAAGCPDARGTSVLHIHGTNDQNVPLGGGRGDYTQKGVEWSPVGDGLVLVAEQNGCRVMNPATGHGDVFIVSTSCPDGIDIQLATINAGGHAWPGAKPSRKQNNKNIYVCQHFDATNTIGQFFTDH